MKISFSIKSTIQCCSRLAVFTIAMNLFSRIWRIRVAFSGIGSRPEGSVRLSRLPFPKPQRINPPRRIRRIRVQVQPARIAYRVFADKPSDLGIIVPMAVVVQPCFVVVVLALKSDWVGQAFLPCPVRALFCDFAPRLVLRGPGHVAVVVGQFLRGAEVVAVVPGQGIQRLGFGFVDPQRIFVDVISALVGRLGQLNS